MNETKAKFSGDYHIRKLAKSGNSRYLSVGRIVSPDWIAVKVFVIHQTSEVCTLRLEQIK